MSIIWVKILLTLAVLGFSAVPAIFDSNSTHATNPLWTPHARFHVVWQVVSYVCLGLVSLCLIWTAGVEEGDRLWLAATLCAAPYIGFFTAMASKPLYGGANADANGVPPLRFGRVEMDANVTIFTVATSILAVGIIALLWLGDGK
ncbi:hypothetical protein [Oryzicola mucosus]|uniref:Uncharacterized protein n=1 Tax=Oryzicola mucosus TaxID=2767425 RepID=A0A8J6PYG3_9HYPH|nr:hypothetical protein [Oryzicola mucosus]MBD0416798.1 hypothetical protein [Oryzicola mucosus]